MPTADRIFSIDNKADFKEAALQIFRFQIAQNNVYQQFVTHLGVQWKNVKELEDIPFLPISLFKTHTVKCDDEPAEVVFKSSGTTGNKTSKHFVTDVSWYQKSFRKGFKKFYGEIKNYVILALLPAYQERDGSSLIYMVDDLIRESENPLSGYFLYNHEELAKTLMTLEKLKTPTILIGVTYALLDFIENHSISFSNLIIMETGGMKGRRKEMIREELHAKLCEGFGVSAIHSEYGMTELLSQAYSLGNGIFDCPPWMNILVRDTNDPLSLLPKGQTGGINVIDLANINSCSFIATQDLGKIYQNNSFEVLGRFDNSDIRGCNLLVQ